MRAIRTIPVLAVVVVALYSFGALDWLALFLPASRGAAFETWESEGHPLTIRVTAYAEKNGGFVPGAYYRFEYRLPQDTAWREVVIFRHDDPISIPRDQVRFLSDEVAYLFMGWVYAVTTDGGDTWSVWSAEKDLPGWQCCNYGLIKDVVLAPDGTGTMALSPIPGRRGEVPRLVTRDFGRTWQPQ